MAFCLSNTPHVGPNRDNFNDNDVDTPRRSSVVRHERCCYHTIVIRSDTRKIRFSVFRFDDAVAFNAQNLHNIDDFLLRALQQ